MGMALCDIAQFTSSSTAAVAVICLGYVPDLVEYYENCQGTNPNKRVWVNTAKYSMAAAGADDTILVTGSSGVYTLDTASIAAHTGGDDISDTDVTNRKYFDVQGNVLAATETSKEGISIPAGDQTNSGKNILLCWRAENPKRV